MSVKKSNQKKGELAGQLLSVKITKEEERYINEVCSDAPDYVDEGYANACETRIFTAGIASGLERGVIFSL